MARTAAELNLLTESGDLLTGRLDQDRSVVASDELIALGPHYVGDVVARAHGRAAVLDSELAATECTRTGARRGMVEHADPGGQPGVQTEQRGQGAEAPRAIGESLALQGLHVVKIGWTRVCGPSPRGRLPWRVVGTLLAEHGAKGR